MRKLLVLEEVLDPVAVRLLLQPSQPVKTIDGVVREVAAFLEHQMTLLHSGRTANGFAAVQFGEPIRVLVIQWDTQTTRVLINPEIFSEKGSVIRKEECFSLPGKAFIVERPKTVKCRALNLNGETVTMKGHGPLAQILKHEVEHLDGILIDKIAERRLY